MRKPSLSKKTSSQIYDSQIFWGEWESRIWERMGAKNGREEWARRMGAKNGLEAWSGSMGGEEWKSELSLSPCHPRLVELSRSPLLSLRVLPRAEPVPIVGDECLDHHAMPIPIFWDRQKVHEADIPRVCFRIEDKAERVEPLIANGLELALGMGEAEALLPAAKPEPVARRVPVRRHALPQRVLRERLEVREPRLEVLGLGAHEAAAAAARAREVPVEVQAPLASETPSRPARPRTPKRALPEELRAELDGRYRAALFDWRFLWILLKFDGVPPSKYAPGRKPRNSD